MMKVEQIYCSNARMMAILTWTACLEFSMTESMATPCSVNTRGIFTGAGLFVSGYHYL
jgi:hypothetical protein